MVDLRSIDWHANDRRLAKITNQTNLITTIIIIIIIIIITLTASMTLIPQIVFFMYLWSIDIDAVLTAMSCFQALCDESDIRSVAVDDMSVVQLLPNYNVYMELAAGSTVLTTGKLLLLLLLLLLLMVVVVIICCCCCCCCYYYLLLLLLLMVVVVIIICCRDNLCK